MLIPAACFRDLIHGQLFPPNAPLHCGEGSPFYCAVTHTAKPVLLFEGDEPFIAAKIQQGFKDQGHACFTLGCL